MKKFIGRFIGCIILFSLVWASIWMMVAFLTWDWGHTTLANVMFYLRIIIAGSLLLATITIND